MAIIEKTHIILDKLATDIQSAEKEILLQIYYIDNDEVFHSIAYTLINKATQGISVYCLFDALGCKDLFESDIEKKLRDAGVHIQYFNWLTPWANKNKTLWYFRNHKRSLIIDRKVLHTGGWCMGLRTQNWIEGHIKSFDHEVVTEGVSDFWNMYTYAHKTQLRFKHQNKYVYSPHKPISYSYQAPTLHGRYIYYTHKQLIRSSHERVILMAPYFAPIPTLKKYIYSAKKRGVHVDIFIPKKTDNTFTDLVAKTYIEKLLISGVCVYFTPDMIHAKAGLFDNTLYIGSSNLDAVSLRYNFENGIYTQDMQAIQDFTTYIETLKMSSESITLENWNSRSLFEKFLDRFMRLFRAFA